MFTLKFYKHFESGQETETVVSCTKYEKTSFNESAYSIMVDGTEYRVSAQSDNNLDFSHCFIENSAGKTIDRIAVSLPKTPKHDGRGPG